MKTRKKTIILLSAFAAGICYLSLFNDRGDKFIDRNTEALATSESYSLGDCIFKSSNGNVPVVDLFCNPETEEYVLHECGYAYGYPTTRTGKCVFE